MDFAFESELGRLGEEARRVGAAAAALRQSKEQSWITGFDRAFSEELGRRGWLGMTWPRDLGGGGRTALERFIVAEALISSGAPVAATWVGDRQIGPTLIAYGSEEQKRRYLPAMIDGTVTWCIGMSEPDAGTDLASIRTTATSDAGGFVIEGRKIWTSFAAEAQYAYVIARTGQQGNKHAGLSEFIVDMTTPGVTVHSIVDSTGESHFCEVELNGVRVGRDNLVGSLNNSWSQLMRQLEHERAGVDRLMSNRSLYEDARSRANTSDPLVRDELAKLEIGFRIGRLMILREILNQVPRSFSAVTKVFCTEHEQRVAQFVSSVTGPSAMLVGRPSNEIVYAPAYTIQGGTSTILRNVIGERILGLPKP